jgi:hypothetical protein
MPYLDFALGLFPIQVWHHRVRICAFGALNIAVLIQDIAEQGAKRYCRIGIPRDESGA